MASQTERPVCASGWNRSTFPTLLRSGRKILCRIPGTSQNRNASVEFIHAMVTTGFIFPFLCLVGMASHVQVFSPHTLQSSAFCSVKKLKVEPSSNWDMTGYGSHSKVYSQSKNVPPCQPATTTVSTSLPIPNPSLPYEQTIIFPGSTGHIVVTSASRTSPIIFCNFDFS